MRTLRILFTLYICLFGLSKSYGRYEMPPMPSTPIVLDTIVNGCREFRLYYLVSQTTIYPKSNPTIWKDDVRWYYQFDENGIDKRYPIVIDPNEPWRTTYLILRGKCNVYIRSLQLDNYAQANPGAIAPKNNWSLAAEISVGSINTCVKPPKFIVRGAELYNDFTGIKILLEGTQANTIRWYTAPFEFMAGSNHPTALLHTGQIYNPGRRFKLKDLYVCAYNSTLGIESNRIRFIDLIKNTIIENTILKDNVRLISQLQNLNFNEVQKVKTYYDGISREIQKIYEKQSPELKDIVYVKEYDNRGNLKRSYLPYTSVSENPIFRENGIEEQKLFYASNSTPYVSTNFAFQEYLYEQNPLNRKQEESLPGDTWRIINITNTDQEDHTLNYKTTLNVLTDSILNYQEYGLFYKAQSYYASGQLHVDQVTNENNNIVRKFTNAQGQLICEASKFNTTWYKTYYIYDYKGRVKYIVQPEGAVINVDLTNDFIDKFVFAYTYDDMDRILSKRIPGKGLEEFVYNSRSQLVLKRDAKLITTVGSQGEQLWQFFKYDFAGRIVYSGLTWIDSVEISSINSNTNKFEQAISTGYGYTNVCFPIVAEQDIHNITFYDTYDYISTGVNYESAINTQVRGLVTKTITRNILPNGQIESGVWLNKYHYYDTKNRLNKTIEEFKDSKIIVNTTYDFIGNKVTENNQYIHLNTNNNSTILKTFTYDHAKRLKSISQKVNNQASIVILSNVYDELGNLSKKHHNIQNSEPLFETKITQNIRGWTTEMKSTYTKDTTYCQTEQLFNASDLVHNASFNEIERDEYYGGNHDNLTWAAFKAAKFIDLLVNNGYNDEHFQNSFYENLPMEGADSKSIFGNQIKYKLLEAFTNSLTSEIPAADHADVSNLVYEILSLVSEEKIIEQITYQNCSTVTSLNNLYTLKLGYDEQSTISANTAQYNGNISRMSWQTLNQTEREYANYYDDINRLTQSDYSEKSGTSWQSSNKYDLNEIRYDKNGNILKFKQNGLLSTNSFGTIDELTYTYNGNQLNTIEDLAANGTFRKDFSNRINTGAEYLYDGNGNMIEDKNKQMTVYYNYLNLPSKIDFGNGNEIFYIYDTNGKKRSKKVHTNLNGNIITNITEYHNEFVLVSQPTGQQNGLQMHVDYISNEVGRIVKLSNNQYEQHYTISDHLGSARMSVKADVNNLPIVLQYDSYTPFGLEIAGLSFAGTYVNQNKYNNKELQSELNLNWYDYGARFYDPQIGRWHSVDPLAEKYLTLSSYNFCANNPILFIDIDGREIIATNLKAQEMITNTLSKEDRNYVRFNNEGKIDKELLSHSNSESNNLNSLRALVFSEEVVEVLVDDKYNYNSNDGGKKTEQMGLVSQNDPSTSSPMSARTGEVGFTGTTLYPGNSNERNSTNSNIQIIINSNLSNKGLSQIFSHEAYGHALFKILGFDSSHKFENIDGVNTETNKNLKKQIVSSIDETTINQNE